MASSKVQSEPVSLELTSQHVSSPPPDNSDDFPRGFRFWMVIVALGCTMFLTAFEASVISPALPVIVHDLQGASFIWVGSAYMLAATACVPLCGGLAHAFGRKVTVLVSLVLLLTGSALSGAATSMSFLIGSRVVQGLGAGGVTATAAIIISDLVPLRQRGVYNGYIGIAWAVGSSIGPVVGGALAENGSNWRWIFYLNIPFCVAAFILLALCLRPSAHPVTAGTTSEKFLSMDWVGIFVVMGSSVLVVIALTWGGDRFAWGSGPVLGTLIAGLVGLASFVLYEAKVAKHPLVPFSLLASRTGLSGYLQTFLFPILVMGYAYSLAVYYQACKGASPLQSGVWGLGFAAFIPVAGIIAGITVKKSGKYRAQLWFAWVALIAGTGAMISLDEHSPRAQGIGLTFLPAVGMGIMFTGSYFPVLAPVPPSLHGLALAFYMFLRSFAQVWGIAISGAVLQNGLQSRIPPPLLAQLPGGGESLIYAAIPLLPHLPADQRAILEKAFAESLQNVWKVFTGIAALGLLVSLLMQALRLHTEVQDEDSFMHMKDETSDPVKYSGDRSTN